MTPRTTYSSISTLRINGLEEINMLTVFGCIKMYEMPVYDMHRERTVYTRFIMTLQWHSVSLLWCKYNVHSCISYNCIISYKTYMLFKNGI